MRILAFYLALNSLFSNYVVAQDLNDNWLDRRDRIERKSNLKRAKFTLNNYAIEHQGKNTLDLEVSYSYLTPTTSSTFEKNKSLARQLQQLLKNYSNETDFWEVINCYLTKQLLKQNKELASISIELAVRANRKLPYDRASVVTRLRNDRMWETWHFDVRSDAVEQTNERFAKIKVEYKYKSDRSDYPDFVPIYKKIEKFIIAHAKQNESWESIDRQLTNIILKENPKISYLSIELIK